MQLEVVVSLKPEVLDTEGRAIQTTMYRLGFDSLESVSVSKRFILEFDEADELAFQKAEKLAKEHLSNPVSETYLVRKLS